MYHLTQHLRAYLSPVEAGKDPGIAYCSSTDHDRIAAGMPLHPFNICDCFDIPVAYDRDLNGLLYFSNGIPVCLSAVALFLRASMNRDRCTAVLFYDASNQQIIAAVFPAQANFPSHRHFQYHAQFVENMRHFQRCAHQTYTGAKVRYGFGRATQVDINDIGG